MTLSTPPRWDLSNVYPALDSPEFSADFQKMSSLLQGLESFLAGSLAETGTETDPPQLAGVLDGLVERLNALIRLSVTLRAYIHSFVATDSFDQLALRLLSEFEQLNVKTHTLEVQAETWIGQIAPALPAALEHSGPAQAHAFYLQEAAEQSQYLMSQAEETLAAELNLSGANAWNKLQGKVTSQLSVDFELDGQAQKLPMPALINLHSHASEAVRRRAYQAEMSAWETVREPLAAAMNGVKGAAITLNRHRGRIDALHPALDSARIDRPTLEVMLEAMHDSFPAFRRYFLAKARRMGRPKLPWWDLFAPQGQTETHYSFEQARAFILENFASFSPDLAAFARQAFDRSWIDAEQRVGKRGGAFCMSVPGVQESRILCNFDGSLDQVFTIAHELGHGFHNHCMFQAGKTELQRSTPMTLAETASIMCETIVMNATLAQAASPQEELAILETSLIGSSQVIVDIYARFLFEREVFERRAQAELSADELCEIMERAQKETYGEALDENYLHKYMWTWKPHYYYPSLSFYNFPYAFGLLFGTGLYAIYRQRGAAFVPDYVNLLASTGEQRAAELAARFAIDIRQKAFWAASLKVIEQQIDRYKEL
jgi:oligoendopeptidase F